MRISDWSSDVCSSDLEVSRRAVLEAVPDYWGEGPYLDRIECIDVSGNDQAIVNALASRQVDGAFQILPDFFPVLQRAEHLAYYEVTTADTAVTRMNVTHKPFDDPRVRLAFRLAVDPATASAVTHGPFSTPAEHHPDSQVNPVYAKLAPCRHDPARAQALLAEAGYPEGSHHGLPPQQTQPQHFRHATRLTHEW